MDYDGLDAGHCPDCGATLREQPSSLVCPACGWSIDAPPVVMPPEFDGPTLYDGPSG